MEADMVIVLNYPFGDGTRKLRMALDPDATELEKTVLGITYADGSPLEDDRKKAVMDLLRYDFEHHNNHTDEHVATFILRVWG